MTVLRHAALARRARRIAVAIGCAAVMAASTVAVAAGTTVHGSADAFAAPGIALAWGVLRGATDDATVVVIRIAADPGAYPFGRLAGVDPFTRQTKAVLPATALDRVRDVRIPRAQFADYPRTELHLYRTAAARDADAADLVVYYQGVPDTTPEFLDAAAQDADLDRRLARARSAPGSHAP